MFFVILHSSLTSINMYVQASCVVIQAYMYTLRLPAAAKIPQGSADG